MKNRFLIIILFTGIACFFAACNGDHSTRSGIDTVKNQYGIDTARANKSTIDTTKEQSPDKSPTGGASPAKDTTKSKRTP